MQSTSVDYGDHMLKDLRHHHYEKVKGYHGLTGFYRSEIFGVSGLFNFQFLLEVLNSALPQ